MKKSVRTALENLMATLIALGIAVYLLPDRSKMLYAADKPNSQATSSTAEPLQSGLKVGDRVQTFYVRAITGPLKNKSVCYVCRNGDRPVVMIFVRRITPELKKLLKGIDAEIDAHRAAGLRGFGVFLAGVGNELLPQVQTLAFDEKISLPLTIAAAPSDGSAGGTIHPDAAVTVMLYRDQIVTANFAYRGDELQDREIEKILKGIRILADE
jgi:hypothetical protein